MTTGLMAKEFLELVIRPTLVVLAKADARLKSAAASLGAGSPEKWASTYRSECAGIFNV